MTRFGGARETALCVEIIRSAAASEILPRFRQMGPGAVRAKSTPDDLVTDADLAAEEAISRALARNFPEALVLGEEAIAADPGLLDRLPVAELAFVIDPIDGTWNYVAGLATFGVILAVVARGQTVLGLLYDPVMDDWVVARAGGGAWFERPGESPPRRLRLTSRHGSLASDEGLISPANFARPVQARLAAQLTQFGRVEGLRCSCHEYRMLVQGAARFGLSGSLNVWDHAAGALAMAEAGGVGCLLEGGGYRPALREGHLLVADSAALLADLTARFSWLARERG